MSSFSTATLPPILLPFLPPIFSPLLPLINDQTALFLDFDGTLVELAATPDAVRVTPGVVATLKTLQHQLGGALAVVSGRKLTDLDAFLQPERFAAAAEHGAQRRNALGQLSGVAPVDLQQALVAAQALVLQYPALLLEPKISSISLHYRQAPELEALCLATLQAASQLSPGLELIVGKFVVELKPKSASKGSAIADFMQETPFIGRQSIFAGDDVTDESGFKAAQSMGGQAVKVGDGVTLADYRCPGVPALLAWLDAAALQLGQLSLKGATA